VTPAQVLDFERGWLRRAAATGDPEQVFDAVERVVEGAPSSVLLDEASEAFYAVFWLAVEDPSLAERAGALDLLFDQRR